MIDHPIKEKKWKVENLIKEERVNERARDEVLCNKGKNENENYKMQWERKSNY